MSEAMRTQLTFTVEPYAPGELDVVGVTGSERLSRPFSFDVDILAREGERAPLSHLVGARARLGLPGAEGRQIAGIVARAQARGMVDELPLYRLRLVPRLWLLSQRRTSRIFQHMSAPEIARAVLSEHHIEQGWKLEQEYPQREYCVQYRETDLQFVTRLLAEEGIFYFIADPSPDDANAQETVVLADAASAHQPVAGDPRVLFRSTGALFQGEQITSFALEEQVRSAATLHRAFDFKRPMLDLRGEARIDGGAGGVGGALEVYDHDGDPEEGRIDGAGARTALEQLRSRARVARGRGTCARLGPGGSFAMAEHPREDMNRRYTVVRLDHEARQVAGQRGHGSGEKTYENRFTCVPDGVAYRPERPRRKLQQVTETATVVGPPGEEIFVDEHGRVKVQFHWDREGQRDDRSSCWLRTMQPWAGSAWGSQFIPRIGMEVVVTFTGGDIDRPMILGTVYNSQNPTPFSLPANKTQSGIRTRTSPGGAGSNELRFEDAAGKEQVFLHAQRDLDEVVENNHTRAVHGDEAISIGRSSSVDVGGDQEVSVKGNEVVTIEKNLVLHVIGRQIIHFDGQGADDEGDTSAEPPGAEERAGATRGGEGAPPPAETLSEDDVLAQKIAAAKLLFLREQVPGDLYQRASALVDAAEAAASKLTALQQDAQALEAGIESAVPHEVAARARELRDAAGAAISDALQPVPPALHRLQVAVVERLQAVWRGADRVQKRLLPEGAAGPAVGGGSGQARGGGGAGGAPKGTGKGGAGKAGPGKGAAAKDDPAWKKDTTGKTSVLTIKGGGVIDSPQGLKLTGQNAYIDMEGGAMVGVADTSMNWTAPAINVYGGQSVNISAGAEIILQVGGSSIRISEGGIKITSDGAVQINGSFITLN